MKLGIFFIFGAIILSSCQNYTAQSDQPTLYRAPGEWGASADYYYEMRDISAAQTAIETYVHENGGNVCFVSELAEQHIIQFALPLDKFSEIENKMLTNSELSYYARYNYNVTNTYKDADAVAKHLESKILITVVMNKKHVPGPLTIALWLPAKILEKLVWLD